MQTNGCRFDLFVERIIQGLVLNGEKRDHKKLFPSSATAEIIFRIYKFRGEKDLISFMPFSDIPRQRGTKIQVCVRSQVAHKAAFLTQVLNSFLI